MMNEYGSNSHRSREARKDSSPPEKKVKKIITGEARSKKKSGVQKVINVLISEDVDNVKSYILLDVLLPTIKNAISDVVINGIDMILYGEPRNVKKGSSASKISYRNYYERENNRKDYTPARNKAGYSYDDILLDNRGEAEDVLSRMDELISVYGLVSVADLYDLVGITGSYTDNKYGWTDIRSAQAVRVKDGYMIKLPKALPLN